MEQQHFACGCHHCVPYHTQYLYQEPHHAYTQHVPQQYPMHDQRPSSSGYDNKPPMHQQQHVLQPPPQIFRPQTQLQYPYAPETPRQNYAPEWQLIQPMPAPHQYPQSSQSSNSYAFNQLYHPQYQQQAQYGYMPLGQQQSAPNPQTFAPLVQPPPAAVESTPLAGYHSDLQHGLSNYVQHGADFSAQEGIQFGALGTSPEEQYLENHSASSSDCGWQLVDESPRSSFESFTDPTQDFSALSVPTAVSNPGLTLHIRSDSDSSHEEPPLSASSFSSFENVPFPMDSPTFAPAMMSDLDAQQSPEPPASANSLSVEPSSPSQTRKSTSTSPPSTPPRSRQKRNSQGKPGKVLLKKPLAVSASIPKVESDSVEKRGRRKGPLRPEQRKQAGEIRKIKACLRCRFLKKTCDTNEICAGCKPSHARLWQVPCCRNDVKDMGYFVNGWNVDHERHTTLAMPQGNIISIHTGDAAPDVHTLWVSHGYGLCFSVEAQEVVFRDNTFSLVDWSESQKGGVGRFNASTANFSIPTINDDLLMEYIDRHLGPKFPDFVRKHFQGTEFLTEMLLTAHRFHKKTNNPVVKKALKLLVAYNLTQQVSFIEQPTQAVYEGKIRDPSSKFHSKNVAPMLINQAIKTAMAQMWRELQRDVLTDLGVLFHKVYTGDKLKNWPTIFIVASLLLAVWEEMQFDAHYREPDHDVVEKFCTEMEEKPVGVIVGLFHAISQKVPAFSEWDTDLHHHLLHSNEAACEVMDEVKDHFHKHEDYLRDRNTCEFDVNDFDSLSNKFLSKLVIKP